MKIRTVAVCLLCAFPVMAAAEVSLYGSLRVGVDSMKSTDTGFHRSTGIDDFSSRVGFKGEETLDGQLQAIWQVETGLAMDGVATGGSGSGTLANRMSFVGLQDRWGKLRAGFIDDVLTNTQATDIFGSPRREASSGIAYPLYEARDIFGSNNYGDSRSRNSLRYDSPRLLGLAAALQYGAGEAQAGGRKTGDTWGMRLSYENAGYFINYALMTRLNAIDSHNSSIHRLEAGMQAEKLELAATLQQIRLYGNAYKNKDNSSDFEIPGILQQSGIAASGNNKLTSQVLAVSAAYRIGNFKPMALYSHRGKVRMDGQSLNWSANQWAAGVEYSMSKRTRLNAGYGQVRQNAGGQSALAWAESTASTGWLMMRTDF
ncbi:MULTISPECIES: porin [Aquitalea]|uniref:porin n=1 Tax=Aquitalea TaxID=407217 RepID=UPI00135C0AD6|nr:MULTISPECIES: porin [Aquitalea]